MDQTTGTTADPSSTMTSKIRARMSEISSEIGSFKVRTCTGSS